MKDCLRVVLSVDVEMWRCLVVLKLACVWLGVRRCFCLFFFVFFNSVVLEMVYMYMPCPLSLVN